MDGALLREERYESEREFVVVYEYGVSERVARFAERLEELWAEPEALLAEAIAFADMCVETQFADFSNKDVKAIGTNLSEECGAVLPKVSPEAEIVPRWLASMFEFWDAHPNPREGAFWLSIGDQLDDEYHRAVVKRWLPFLREQAGESSRRARQVITCLQYGHSSDGRWLLDDIRQNHADPDVRAYADYAMKHRWLR